MKQWKIHRLPCGLQVLIVQSLESQVSHCGLLIGAGTREEKEEEAGLAHFIEHCLFKGTRKRRAYHILNRLETVGGELNAYTTKEETCLHASVMDEHLERALELISDIAFHSVFPVREIDKEKDVIIDEINSYQDTPYEQIFDDFEGLVFAGHPLGHPILGTNQSVRSFRQRQLKEFTAKHYHAGNMVLAISTSQSEDKVLRVVERHFSAVRSGAGRPPRHKARKSRPVSKEDSRALSQVHFISGRAAYGLHHPDRYALVLLNNLLGGPGMNSILNLRIRERYGYTYTIESGYHTFTDNGIFHIYFATDERNYKRVLALLGKELDILTGKPLTERQLNQYKEQLVGQIRLAQESRLSVLLSMAKSLLNLGRVLTQDEVFNRIRSVNSSQLSSVARDILDPAGRSELIYRPAVSAGVS
ncbi:MAG: insulinase family protein [Sphingobacteriales bacterium]|jgi:predicted Zn-dependent peptidase|nr:insulinase family protein [Sphingobacteriales bacterium]